MSVNNIEIPKDKAPEAFAKFFHDKVKDNVNDILIDENWQIWLMEVNANPSLNVYNDKELPNGDIEQTLSEIDKYVKTNLLADTILLVSTAPVF